MRIAAWNVNNVDKRLLQTASLAVRHPAIPQPRISAAS